MQYDNAAAGRGAGCSNNGLAEVNRVRVLVRSLHKLPSRAENLELRHGSIIDTIDTDELVAGVNSIVLMLGGKFTERYERVNTAFV